MTHAMFDATPAVPHAIGDEALDQLFRAARSHNKWQDRPVSDTLLMALYDLMRWGPTAANTSPARFLFLTSGAAKARLQPYLDAGNREKAMRAPVTAIVGYDLDFFQQLPKLFPHNPRIREAFAADPARARAEALRNGSLQGGYFILAARALGLDCGPMGGFDRDGVDREFFAGTSIKSNFLCALGYGDPAGLYPRNPRLAFDEACGIL